MLSYLPKTKLNYFQESESVSSLSIGKEGISETFSVVALENLQKKNLFSGSPISKLPEETKWTVWTHLTRGGQLLSAGPRDMLLKALPRNEVAGLCDKQVPMLGILRAKHPNKQHWSPRKVFEGHEPKVVMAKDI